MVRPPRAKVHQPLVSRRVPKRQGVGNQAVKVEYPGEMLYISQQLPITPPRGKLVGGDSKRQIETCLNNLVNLIKDGGFETDHIVQLRVYLIDLAEENNVNAALSKSFVGGNFPAVTIVKVAGLPEEAAVAMEAVAIKPAEDEEY